MHKREPRRWTVLDATLTLAVVALLTCQVIVPVGRADDTQNNANPLAQLDQPTDSGKQIDFAIRRIESSKPGQNIDADIQLLQQAATSGNAAAQTFLGLLKINGRHVGRDPAAGLALLRQAAAQHFPPALQQLALSDLRQLVAGADQAEGFRVAKEMAAANSPQGFALLGFAFAYGAGVEKDAQLSVVWLRKAIDGRSAMGMEIMAESYLAGIGVERSPALAYTMFLLASQYARGTEYVNAVNAAEQVSLLLLPAERRAAVKVAGHWQPGTAIATADLAVSGNNADESKFDQPVIAFRGPLRIVDPAANASAAAKPYAAKRETFDIKINADGSYTSVIHAEWQVRGESAIKDISQQSFLFDPSREQVDVDLAVTQKASGEKIAVDPGAIYVQQAPIRPDALTFVDERQKTIVFPQVEAGDTLIYTVRYTSKPRIDGHFSFSQFFDPAIEQDDVEIKITAPKSMPLHSETHAVTFTTMPGQDTVSYQWAYHNPQPAGETLIALDPFDRLPRVFVSSEESYDGFAARYAGLIQGKTVLTPDIKTLADQLTAGATDKRQQAGLLYAWVSRHIRYVGIELGLGSLVPRDPSIVVKTGYGDCKDHALLFAKLLEAKGIKAELVLINAGNRYSLPIPPTVDSFNHEIVYLPDFDLYADTTAGVAMFGTLPFEEYGKPVLHIASSGNAVRRIPVLTSGTADVVMTTQAKLGPDGRLIGDSKTTATGPFATYLRVVAAHLQTTGAQQSARQQLQETGLGGTGDLKMGEPHELVQSYTISGHFEAPQLGNLLSATNPDTPLALEESWRPGAMLAGDLNFPDGGLVEPTACWSGHQVEDLSVTLPAAAPALKLPENVTVANDYLHYAAQYQVAGKVLTIHREMTTTVGYPICLLYSRLDIGRAASKIRADYNRSVSLAEH